MSPFLLRTQVSSRIAVGGIVQPTPIRLRYLNQVLAAYEQSYGQPLPTDLWHIHSFMLPENCGWGAGTPPGLDEYIHEGIPCPPTLDAHDDLNTFRQQIRNFRQWMNSHGYRNYPLIISEYGILLSKYHGFTHPRVRDFMLGTFDFMLNTTDSQTGYPADGNRLVQEFGWFSLNYYEFNLQTYIGLNGNLFDHGSRQITDLGLDFENYLKAITVKTVDLAMRTLSADPSQPQSLTPVALQALFVNEGSVAAQDVVVRFWNGDPRAGGQLIGSAPTISQVLPACTTTQAGKLVWTPAQPGVYTIFAELTAANSSLESNRANNYASLTLTVGDAALTATPTTSPTASITPLQTPTPTLTPMPTVTPSVSPTPSPSSVASVTPSATATASPTMMPTPMATPTPSRTPTATTTTTQTPVASATATTTIATTTSTSTATVTPAMTATATSITATPTATATTPIATATIATAMPTAISTATPTIIATATSVTATPTDTATATLTPAPEMSGTPTPTDTATATLTPAPEVSGTSTPTDTATATLTPAPEVSGTPTPTDTATATLTPAPEVSGTPTPTIIATATSVTVTPTDTATATLTPTPTQTSIPTGTSTNTPTPTSTVIVIGNAPVRLEIDVAAATVTAGEDIRYQFRYQNTSDEAITQLVLRLQIPAHTTFNSTESNPNWLCSANSPTAQCRLAVGDLAGGATGLVDFVVTSESGLVHSKTVAVTVIVEDNQWVLTTASATVTLIGERGFVQYLPFVPK